MEQERNLLRWRLILGSSADEQKEVILDDRQLGMDRSLGALFDGDKKGDLSGSNPQIHTWLKDIRTYFPEPVAILLQKEAVHKLGIEKFLDAPDVLEEVVPDIQLAAAILSLKDAIPDRIKDTARKVIERLAKHLERKLSHPFQVAVRQGILKYRQKNRRQNNFIDWHRTIKYNLKHYDPLENRIIPERIFGYDSSKRVVKEIFIVLDQSGSMGSSLVYTGIIACLLHKLPSIKTNLILFDVSVTDMTYLLHDPVDLLFGIQMGGGTDIPLALDYVRNSIRHPRESIVFLISDLYDNAPDSLHINRLKTLKEEGVQLVVLAALSDEGKADFNKASAATLAAIDIPCLAATPDVFCELLPGLIGR
jgi:hypothetical protein